MEGVPLCSTGPRKVFGSMEVTLAAIVILTSVVLNVGRAPSRYWESSDPPSDVTAWIDASLAANITDTAARESFRTEVTRSAQLTAAATAFAIVSQLVALTLSANECGRSSHSTRGRVLIFVSGILAGIIVAPGFAGQPTSMVLPFAIPGSCSSAVTRSSMAALMCYTVQLAAFLVSVQREMVSEELKERGDLKHSALVAFNTLSLIAILGFVILCVSLTLGVLAHGLDRSVFWRAPLVVMGLPLVIAVVMRSGWLVWPKHVRQTLCGALRCCRGGLSVPSARHIVLIGYTAVLGACVLGGLVLTVGSSRLDDCPAWAIIGGGGVPPPPDPRFPRRFPFGLDAADPAALRLVAAGSSTSAVLITVAAAAAVCVAALSLLDSQATHAEHRQRASVEAAGALSRAISYISHEARGPLNAAMLSLELLDDSGDAPPAELEDDEASERDLLSSHGMGSAGHSMHRGSSRGLGLAPPTAARRSSMPRRSSAGMYLPETADVAAELLLGGARARRRQSTEAAVTTAGVVMPPPSGGEGAGAGGAGSEAGSDGQSAAVGLIAGAGALVAGASDEEDDGALLENLGSSVLETQRHLDDLLLWQRSAQPGEGQGLAPEWCVPVDAISDGIRRLFGPSCRSQDVSLGFGEQGDGDGELAVEAYVDATAAATAANNAVSNALKHVPSGGSIEVSLGVTTLARATQRYGLPRSRPPARRVRRSFDGPGLIARMSASGIGGSAASEDGRASEATDLGAPVPGVLCIEVRDTGRGISRALLESGKLFQPFARLRQGDDSLRMASSGLGLAIVRSTVVEALGGEVGLASREGEGTAFFAYVPVWCRRVSRLALEDGSPGGEGGAGLTRHVSLDGGVRRAPVSFVGGGVPAAVAEADDEDADDEAGVAGAGRRPSGARPRRSSTHGHGSAATHDPPPLRPSSSAPEMAGSAHAVTASAPAQVLGGDRLPPRLTIRAAKASAATDASAASHAAGQSARSDVVVSVTQRQSSDRAPGTPMSGQSSSKSRGRSLANASANGSGASQGSMSSVVARLRRIAAGRAVILADPDRTTRTLMAELVSRAGFLPTSMASVLEASGRLAGLAATELDGTASAGWPVAVVTDCGLEGEGEDDVASICASLKRGRLAAQRRGDADAASRIAAVGVVVVSASLTPSLRERLRRDGASAVLDKPVDPLALMRSLALCAEGKP